MRAILGFTSIALSLALGAPAAAQVPWTAEGALTNADDVDPENHRYDIMPILLTGGQRYRVIAESPGGAFDTVVEILRPGSNEALARNDDGGDGLNSRLAFTPDRSGLYLVRVLAFSPDGRGPYVARVETMPPLPPPITAAPTATARTNWRIWEGSIDADDAENDDGRYDDYLQHFEGGRTYYIALDATGSEPFDTFIRVLPADGREGEAIDSDDDGGPGLNSFLSFTPDRDGDYIVRVSPLGSSGTGPYRLRIGD